MPEDKPGMPAIPDTVPRGPRRRSSANTVTGAAVAPEETPLVARERRGQSDYDRGIEVGKLSARVGVVEARLDKQEALTEKMAGFFERTEKREQAAAKLEAEKKAAAEARDRLTRDMVQQQRQQNAILIPILGTILTIVVGLGITRLATDVPRPVAYIIIGVVIAVVLGVIMWSMARAKMPANLPPLPPANGGTQS